MQTDILLIDDDRELTKTISRVLSKEYSVDVAHTIDEALTYLSNKKYPVILLDYNLEDQTMDGINFSNYLRSIHPLSYVILFTGYSDFDVVKRALNEGSINYFIKKPISSDELRKIVITGFDTYFTKIKKIAIPAEPNKSFMEGLLKDYIDEDKYSAGPEIVALFVMKNSLPVFSKYYNDEIFMKFSDTIFAGFMTAINIIGTVVFKESDQLEAITYGKLSLHFKTFEDYLICFVLTLAQTVDHEFLQAKLENITKRIMSLIENKSLLLEWNKKTDSILQKIIYEFSISIGGSDSN